ncbi:MAG TPA: SGNH/GDSL hydrolase family protein [Chitinophagaceae bacterium]|nr:SGNH/GDSL hydrolase family protein [Chitinophagaceae bacterium]
MKKKRSRLLFLLLQLIIICFLVESILSIAYYQKYGSYSLATIQFAKKLGKKVQDEPPSSFSEKNQQLVRPNASENDNRKLVQETMESNRFVYEPWLQFRNMDYTGKFVNVQHLLRRSNPDHYYPPNAKDTLDIYFLGGSTLFGFNVADGETIPSQFLQLYKGDKAIRVYNLGVPYYYSYQELMQLSNLLYTGSRPDIVIQLDGLNDFWFIQSAFYRRPHFTYIVQEVFNMDPETGKFHFKDTFDRMTKDPVNVPAEIVNRQAIDHYFENIGNTKLVANDFNCRTFFFCQPVPFYNYPNQQNDPVCDKDRNTRFDKIYPEVEARGKGVEGFYFLGNMLQQEKQYPFVDGFHYSPYMNRKIAAEILGKVNL